ncbi:MotA/TolQ/ExbB proton channel family protein [Verrucomicrobiota bacterium]
MQELIIKGGALMWPLLACSVISITIVLERIIFWLLAHLSHNQKLINQIFSLTEAGQFEQAADSARKTQCGFCRILTAGLTHRQYGLEECMESAASAEIAKMKRGMSVLDTIITLAPLLGILGTVSGIIASFDLLGEMGIQDPKAVTGGIAQALITTAAGLSVAIVTLIPYNAFVRKVEKFTHTAEKLCTHYCVTVQMGEEKRNP